MSDRSGFTEEQKQYLEGFLSGLARKLAIGGPTPQPAAGVASALPERSEDIHRLAQDRFLAAGRKLVPEEEAKRRKDPFAMWDEIVANGAAQRFPKGTDVFLHKFHGLFYVAPAQNSFMCRLRMPGGILSATQLAGLADAAEHFGGGYTDVTTRANLQIRDIAPGHAAELLMAIQELGLTSRGAGADNIRNVTGSPTAGIDPQELIDTRPLCRALHHYILNHREFYGLPRKFNVGFDGGGQVAVLEDTNDIGFAAVAVDEGEAVPAGVYFRLLLGGITGHGDFARDTGVLLKPEECLPVAAAIIRIFIAEGDRTDRTKARLKYVLDQWGVEKYLAETEALLPFKFTRFPLAACRPRPPQTKHGHIGIRKQRQEGLHYIGIVLPIGRLTAAQMRGLAAIAAHHGSATLRLTVWQNLIVSDIPTAALAAAQAAIKSLGLDWTASHLRGGLIACTGNTGCKFSASDTKGHAAALIEHLEARLTMDQPLNIHLTGCPHSCAQHYIGDIGLLGVRVPEGEDTIEGYAVNVGGGAGEQRRIGREIWPAIPAAQLPERIATMLRAYLAERRPAERFQDFADRHSVDELKRLFDTAPAAAA
jgi:ferredoxin-nitrite reductase